MRDFPTNENPVLWSSLASADLLLSQRFSASFAFVVSTHASTKVHISLDNNDAANQQSSTFQGSIEANHTPHSLSSSFLFQTMPRESRSIDAQTPHLSSARKVGLYPSYIIHELISPDSSGELFSLL
jgi:hypothetical protein